MNDFSVAGFLLIGCIIFVIWILYVIFIFKFIKFFSKIFLALIRGQDVQKIMAENVEKFVKAIGAKPLPISQDKGPNVAVTKFAATKNRSNGYMSHSTINKNGRYYKGKRK